jgi:hypothetical protein
MLFALIINSTEICNSGCTIAMAALAHAGTASLAADLLDDSIGRRHGRLARARDVVGQPSNGAGTFLRDLSITNVGTTVSGVRRRACSDPHNCAAAPSLIDLWASEAHAAISGWCSLNCHSRSCLITKVGTSLLTACLAERRCNREGGGTATARGVRQFRKPSEGSTQAYSAALSCPARQGRETKDT